MECAGRFEKVAVIGAGGKNLNLYDCSKISDGAASIAIVSEEGLRKSGIPLQEAVEIVGFGQAADDITETPKDLTALETTAVAVKRALENAKIKVTDICTVECHDCFTITGILSVEAIGFAKAGEGSVFICEENTSRAGGKTPFNTSGGLIGWGHPTGATGIRQAVTIWQQLTKKAGDKQIDIAGDRPYALSVNMGGDDTVAVAICYKKLI